MIHRVSTRVVTKNFHSAHENVSAVPKRGCYKRGRMQKHTNARLAAKERKRSAKERKRKSAKERKGAQKERKRAVPHKNCKRKCAQKSANERERTRTQVRII